MNSILEDCQGFQWDKGNSVKNWLKHGVTQGEAEEVFFNAPLWFDSLSLAHHWIGASNHPERRSEATESKGHGGRGEFHGLAPASPAGGRGWKRFVRPKVVEQYTKGTTGMPVGIQLLLEDEKHSDQEQRVLALGQSNSGRFLVVSFTVRERLIRVISVRNMNRKERGAYEKA